MIRSLRQNKEIVITRPDKGNGVVILKLSDYVQKMNAILCDESKFQRLGSVETHDSTLQQERALQAFLLRAHKDGHIAKETYDRIRPVGSSRPRMYGLPKLHKEGVPLRPILSMVNAPQHEMAKWLGEVLRPVVAKYGKRMLKDSFEFCDNLQELERTVDVDNSFMCSFDIVSLFTNIPLKETIDIVLNSLYRDPQISPPSQPENLLRKLLLKATSEVEFSFDGTMYRQVDGVAMGSPLGPILANIFVGYQEERIEEEHWPQMYDRFVDDTFSVFQGKERAYCFFDRLNQLHPALRFTMDSEVDAELPFMDVLVQRREGRFIRSVYRKPTFTGLYLQWNSFAPTQQKVSLLRSLTSRAVKICSDSMLSQELDKLRNIFLDNGYPSLVIERAVKSTAQRKVMQEPDGREIKAFLRLPWIGNKSNGLKKEVLNAIAHGFPKVKARIVFTTERAFSGRRKDVLPPTALNLCIYKFTCRCSRTYVGKTTQQLGERIKQHVPDKLFVNLRGKTAVTASDSAITRHLKENIECADIGLRQQFEILARARHSQHLDVLEALYIRSKSPDLCHQKKFIQVLKLV